MSEPQESGHRIINPRVSFLVYLALVAGVGLTIVASYQNLGIFNPILAVAIALVQASLVALFSMHLKYSPRVSKLSVGSGIFMLLTLFAMVLLDYMSRAWGSW